MVVSCDYNSINFYFYFVLCCCGLSTMFRFLVIILCYCCNAFQQPCNMHISRRAGGRPGTSLDEMKRPILDQIATFVFKLENDRVAASSVEDDKGRNGEPMEWAEENSFANQLSEMVSSAINIPYCAPFFF